MHFLSTDQADEQAAAIASVQQQGTITLDPTLQYQLRADNNAGLFGILSSS